MSPIKTKEILESSTDAEVKSHPLQQHVAVESPARTPTQSPAKKTRMITEAQKQALMDNLQLEVTERARKLRAQYALQAQSLRTRVELRINRIPHSLRKANMGELCEKYQQAIKQGLPEKALTGSGSDKPSEGSGQPAKEALTSEKTKPAASPRARGVKRTSDHLEQLDKENTPDPARNLPNPKKRPKTAANAPSRQVTNPSTVLSPKSSNSRTIPQSPIRPAFGSPQKQYLSHPASPLKLMSPSKQHSPMKPISPAKSAAIAATASLEDVIAQKPKATRAKAATTRKATGPMAAAPKAASTRSKRGLEPPAPVPEMRTVSSQSNDSAVSNATTVVNKGKKAPTATAAAAQKKKNMNLGIGATKKKVVDPPPAGRRVLRKRA